MDQKAGVHQQEVETAGGHSAEGRSSGKGGDGQRCSARVAEPATWLAMADQHSARREGYGWRVEGGRVRGEQGIRRESRGGWMGVNGHAANRSSGRFRFTSRDERGNVRERPSQEFHEPGGFCSKRA
jgi:hypothetical protein